jgi:penicillin-insensitive murein endopeptidase
MKREQALALVILVVCLAGTPLAQEDETAARGVRGWGDVDLPAAGDPEPIGSYAAGCVVGAERLPLDGPGYLSVRPARNRHYGHSDLVSYIERLAERTAAAGLGLLPIGDMSQPRGGPMVSGHASHQIGLDVDIFFRLDLPRLPPEERGEDLELPSLVDYDARLLDNGFGEAQIELVRLAADDPGVERIFVSPLIKQAICEREWPDRGFLRTIRPWYGHDDHLHVRLACPPESADCVPQASPPPGDGCGAELESWLETGLVPTPDSGASRSPVLPARCEALR